MLLFVVCPSFFFLTLRIYNTWIEIIDGNYYQSILVFDYSLFLWLLHDVYDSVWLLRKYLS